MFYILKKWQVIIIFTLIQGQTLLDVSNLFSGDRYMILFYKDNYQLKIGIYTGRLEIHVSNISSTLKKEAA